VVALLVGSHLLVCDKAATTAFTLLVTVILNTNPSAAVLYGDEQFGDKDGGRFWVFHSRGVSIVNPDTCKVETTISADDEGNLPSSWYDGVYMEFCPPGSDLLPPDDQQDCKHYVIVNSAVTVTDTHGQDAGSGEVFFFDVKEGKVVSRVLVGPRPVHSYAVYTRNQFWTHADGDGFFYVIDLEDIDKHSGKPVRAKVDAANHGKLLWDESGSLQNTAYATSTGEPHLFIIDMETEEQVGTLDFSDQSGCFGSHAIAYANANQHIYIECTGPGGLLEIDVSTPRDPVVVKQHLGVTGSIYESPDESYVAVSDKGGNKFHLLKPGNTGQGSSQDFSVDIDGHPGSPAWYPTSSSSLDDGALGFNVCLPLTVNTNQNHYDSDGNLACDYYGCQQAQT
jgi:hypothetical protein